MRILYLCHKKYWEKKMSRVRFHSINAIGRQPGVELFKDGPGFDSFSDCEAAIKNCEPDYVIWYKPETLPGYKNAHKCGKPLIIRYNETYNQKFLISQVQKTKTSILCFHLSNDMDKVKLSLGDEVRMFHCPHCAETSVFRPMGLEKEYDILLCGNTSPKVYPIRSWFLRHKDAFSGFKVKVLEHPGYSIKNVNDQVLYYAEQINKAKIVIHCSSVYRYALAKYVEIAACGVCQVADLPYDHPEFYRKFVVEVDRNNLGRAVKKIKHILNHDLWRQYGEKGYEFSKERTQDHYASAFLKGLSNGV